MTTVAIRSARSLWLPWVLTNAVATATSLAVFWGAIHAALSGSAALEMAFEVVYVSGLLFAFVGTLIGLGQWLVLRRLVPGAEWWVPASAAGLVASIVVMFLVFMVCAGAVGELSAIDLIIIGAAGGATAGAVQWVVLRWLVRRPGWWVLASAAGVSAGVFLYTLVTRGEVRLPVISGGGAIAGAVYGAITGSALLTLIPRSLGERESPRVTRITS